MEASLFYQKMKGKSQLHTFSLIFYKERSSPFKKSIQLDIYNQQIIIYKSRYIQCNTAVTSNTKSQVNDLL